MFKGEDFIYIQFQKTACTHIASLFEELFDGETVGKHNRATAEQIRNSFYFISSIRNPWDWYLSLWTFGSQGKGGLRSRLTTKSGKKVLSRMPGPKTLFKYPNQITYSYSLFKDYLRELRKDTSKNKSLYDEKGDPGTFKQWLKFIHEEQNSGLIEDYGNSHLLKRMGIMTYRYLYLCCRDFESLSNPQIIQEYSDLIDFEHENCYVHFFVRQENLEEDLYEVMSKLRPISTQEKKHIFKASKTNSSARKFSISDYYDAELVDLVYERDRLIVDKFNYSPPL